MDFRDLDKPDCHVSPDEFGLQVAYLKNNIEESGEFDDQFIKKL